MWSNTAVPHVSIKQQPRLIYEPQKYALPIHLVCVFFSHLLCTCDYHTSTTQRTYYKQRLYRETSGTHGTNVFVSQAFFLSFCLYFPWEASSPFLWASKRAVAPITSDSSQSKKAWGFSPVATPIKKTGKAVSFPKHWALVC